MFSQTSSSAFNQNIKTFYLLSSSSIGRSVSQFWRLLSRRVLRPVNWLPSASFLFAAAPVRRSLSTHSTKPGCCWQSITSSLLEPLPLRQRPGLPWNSQRMDCWWRRMRFTSSTRQSSWITSPLFPSSHFECHETTTTSVPEKAHQKFPSVRFQIRVVGWPFHRFPGRKINRECPRFPPPSLSLTIRDVLYIYNIYM